MGTKCQITQTQRKNQPKKKISKKSENFFSQGLHPGIEGEILVLNYNSGEHHI